MFFPPIIPIEDLRNVHPWVKSLLSAKIVPNLSLAGRLNHFLEAWDWEILTKDPEILEIVKGFKKPFLKNLTQERILHTPHMGQEQATLIQVEIGKIEEGSHTAKIAWSRGVFEQYFLGREKRWEKSTCGELKIPKPAHSTSAFQTGSLFCLRESLQERDYMCKLDMKDAYFSVPLHPPSRSYIRFSWSGNPYEFHCLCSGLWPAPTIFTKLPIIPMYILRRMNVWIVTCLDDMIMIG